MTDYNSKEKLRLDLMEIQKAQQIRIVKRLQDTLMNTIYRLYVDPILHKHVVDPSDPNFKNITTYQAIRTRFDGVEKGQLCQLMIKEYKKEMITHNMLERYVSTLKSIVSEERVEKPSELKEKTRKKGKIQAAWEAQTWKMAIALLMLANHENPALETFRDMWSHVYPDSPLPVNKPGRKSKAMCEDDDELLAGDEGEDEQFNQDILLKKDSNQNNINTKNQKDQNILNEQSQQNLYAQNTQENSIYLEKKKEVKDNQDATENGQSQNLKEFNNDINQKEQFQVVKNSNLFDEQIQDIYQMGYEGQQIQQQQQFGSDESEEICLECLQNNFNSQISPQQFLINNLHNQNDDYPNASDQYQSNPNLTNLNNKDIILSNHHMNNNPSKFIALSPHNDLENNKNSLDQIIRNKNSSESLFQTQNDNPYPDLSFSNQNNYDQLALSSIKRKNTFGEVQDEYQKGNVNHHNLQEQRSNQFLQLDKSQSYNQSQQPNNYHINLFLETAPTIQKDQNHSSLYQVKKESTELYLKPLSRKDSFDIKLESSLPIFAPPKKFTNESSLKTKEMLTEKLLSSEQLFSSQIKNQMNPLNSNISFLNNNNQIQMLQSHLNNLNQKNNDQIAPLSQQTLQNDEQVKDNNSTQGCSCCDNNQNSPSGRKDSTNSFPQKSLKKTLLLHQNPEKNNLTQQFELKQVDRIQVKFQNNNLSNGNSDKINQMNKCSHTSSKVNGFQIAKSQQAINQQLSDKIAQLEQIIMKQQQDYQKNLEIQDQLQAENALFRNYFEQQMANQSQLFKFLKTQPNEQIQKQQQKQQQQQQQLALQQQQQQLLQQQQIQIIQQQNGFIQQQQPQYNLEQKNYQNQIHNNILSKQSINTTQMLQSLTSDELQNFYQKLNQFPIRSGQKYETLQS